MSDRRRLFGLLGAATGGVVGSALIPPRPTFAATQGDTTIDGSLTVTKTVAIGTTPTPSRPLSIVSTSTTDFAVTVTSAVHALLLEQPTFLNGQVGDVMNIVTRSTGDGLYVNHVGGAPPGYTGAQGGNAALNGHVPYYLDHTGTGREGTVVNQNSGMKGLSVEVQPVGTVYGIYLNYSGATAALSILNQSTDYPQGNGHSLYIQEWGTGAPIKIDHMGTGLTPGIVMANYGSTSRFMLTSRQGNEAWGRFIMDYSGKLLWGGGAASVDVTLQRHSAGRLLLEGALMTRTNLPSDLAFLTAVVNEPQLRFTIQSDGKMAWGAGSASVDTTLYRGSAHQLKTDDLLQAVDGLATKVKAGTPVAADFQASPPDGTLVVDTAGSKLWVRVSGTWKSTPLT